jgi:hypothetical protein
VRYFIVFALCVILCHCSFGQSFTFIGARANGLAYASSSLADEWAIFNNPAGTAFTKENRVAVAYDATPGFSFWNRSAAVTMLPFKGGGVNIGIIRAGDAVFNEQMFAASYANKFGIASLGVSLQYIQYNAEGIGRKGAPTFTAGSITELTPWLKIGACIMNVTQPDITEEEKIPTVLLFGISLKASEKVFVFMEVEKNIEEDPLLKASVEYRFNEKFSLRTGFHPEPVAGFFGFGFRRKKLQVDYAFSYYPQLGTRHQTGFSYIIRTQK